VRGEVTIVVTGADPSAEIGNDPDSLRAAVADLQEADGLTKKEAIAEAAKRAGVPKREVYDLVHKPAE